MSPNLESDPAAEAPPRRLRLARWVGGRFAATCLLIAVLGVTLAIVSRHHPFSRGIAIGPQWIEVSVFHGLLELRWADLGGTGIEDVLAGSRREWRFMREILSMGEWLSSYVPRDPKTRPHFSNASMDTRNHSDIGAWIHDVETTVVVKSWDTEAWKPSPGANVTVTPWLLHSRTVYSATVELLMIGIPLRLTASCLFVLCAVHAAIKVRRRQLRKRSGTCMKCGYNLTGNVSGVCPECGTACGGTSGSRT